MHSNPGSNDFPEQEQLTPTGQLLGWCVFGGFVVIGFFFGIVTGFDQPKAADTAKASPSRETPWKDDPKPNAKLAPEPLVPNPPAKTELERKSKLPDPLPSKTEPPKLEVVPKKVEPKPKELTPVSFRTEVAPILRRHCFECHGSGKGKPKADVDLTSIAAMRKSPGKILEPGKPDASDLYTSVTERDMPDQGRPKPRPEEWMIVRNWILSGAKDRRRRCRG